MINALLETGFLISLNPRDKNHEWAIGILRNAKSQRIRIFISPASPIELSLILKSRGLDDSEIENVLKAMDSIVRKYSRPLYPPLTMECTAYAAKLRKRYNLSFFDSIHAAIALKEDLTYYDLDPDVSRAIESERAIK